MSKNVVATIREDAPFVPAGRYYLFSEPEAWTLMPTDEGSGQLPLTLDKGAYTLTADAAPTEPDEIQGHAPRVQGASDRADADRCVAAQPGGAFRVVPCGKPCGAAGTGDWTAAVPESRRTRLRKVLYWLRVADGGELLSKGKLEVWREGDTLCFFRRDRNLYTGKDNLYSGELPVQAIRFYRLCGGMRTETRVSGGGVTVDRSAAYWAGWEHPFSFNPHGRAIEAAVQSEPVRTEQVQHDERYVQLRVQWENRRVDLRFSPDSLAAFDALIPEKEFDEVALSDRTPTPVEQLSVLAGLCERGFVTREEFEQAKARLLGKI